MTWEDARTFATALSGQGEGHFRLPSEAEWEYACRASSNEVFYFGDDAQQLSRHAWYASAAQGERKDAPQPAGGKEPNAWGLKDILGNVWEWCEDTYRPYAQAGAQEAEASPENFRVVRGGSYNSTLHVVRCSARMAVAQDTQSGSIGFRLVREP